MICVPHQFKPLLNSLVATFDRSATARRMVLFSAAAVLTIGDRTVSNVLRLLNLVDHLNPSTYHRLFSHRHWSTRPAAYAIAKFVIERWLPNGVIRLCGDETVDGHRGKKVYGKARHRDAVRSSHSNTVFRYGHKWIVLAILVDIPYCNRPLTLPILVTLYRTQEANKKEKRRHRTPAELMCVLLTLLMHWFPERKFLFAGDGAYGTHQVSRFAYRHRQRLGLVSKFVADANVSLSVKAIIEMYAARWNIETTFQEMRSHLGLETTCGWSKQTVLRMAPLLFCLYTLRGRSS